MSTPLVAIVGRPNVGKSTLFNRIIGGRRALVQDDPGVTRDRHYGTARWSNMTFSVVDTGGFEPEVASGIESLIKEQTIFAIEEADLMLVVLDAREGLVETDMQIVRELRRSSKPMLLLANKADGPRQEAQIGELYRLGAEHIFPVSAEHGLGIEELLDALIEKLPGWPPVKETPSDGSKDSPTLEMESPLLRLALVGRPNAGKSSLLNRLVGYSRAIVSDLPGTTRDPVDVRLETPQGTLVIVDTAGIRRRRSSSTAMEKLAILRALRSIEKADVGCLLIDAQEGVAEQEAKIAGLTIEHGKGLVLVFTKMDLLWSAGNKNVKQKLRAQVEDKLQFVTYAPLVFLSALTGRGTNQLFPAVRRVDVARHTRIRTAELNRFLTEAVAAHQPPSPRGRPIRFYYIAQPEIAPPTFIVSTNVSPKNVHFTYQRYLANQLRQRFGFTGTPIRIFFRKRGKG